MSITEQMALIMELDAMACVRFSRHTGKWYVAATLEISDGCFLTGVTEHRHTPERAVAAYLERIQSVAEGERVVAGAYTLARKEWRWDGIRWRQEVRSPA
jgi:hypothetical protein